MDELLGEVLEAHGGLHTWSTLREFRAHITGHNPLLVRKGFPDVISDATFVGRCHDQEVSISPFLGPGQRAIVRPTYAAVEDKAGETILERHNPRSAFPADPAAPWDALNLAYFAGYAMWNYLNAPFIFTLPEVKTQELAPVQEDGESLRRLLVQYPEHVMTHSREETFYISSAGLIVRVDYAPEVNGNLPDANFASEHREVAGGLTMPTRRTIYRIGPDGIPNMDTVLVSVEMDRLEYV